MRSEIKADFVLVDATLDPDRVTSLLGIQPTEIWRAGELRGKSPLLRHVNNGWVLSSGLPVTSGLEEHTKALLDQIEPAWDAAVALGDQFYAEFAYAVYSYGGDRPAIHFDSETVRRAAELHAAFDVDLFVLP